MSDLERRALLHLLDGQQLMLAVMGDTDTRVVAAATAEWLDVAKSLRGELEDDIVDDSWYTTEPGCN